MTKSIVVTVPHNLGLAEAKKRVNERIELLRSTYVDKLAHSEMNWEGDTANLRVVALGQTATGRVDVTGDAMRIEVELPWMLAMLSGKVEGLLNANVRETLQIGHMPKPK